MPTHVVPRDRRSESSGRARSRHSALITLAVAVLASGAAAQPWGTGGAPPESPMAAIYQMFEAQNRAVFAVFSDANGPTRTQVNRILSGASGAGTTTVSASHPISATDLPPSPSRVAPGQLAQAAQPSERAATLQAMQQILDLYEQGASQNGVRPNNAAYAVAILLLTSKEVSSRSQLSEEAGQQLVLVANDAMAGSRAFSTLPAAQKQALYETAIILGTVMASAAQTPETAPQAAQLAGRVLAAFGVEASAVPQLAQPPSPMAGAPVAAPNVASAPPSGLGAGPVLYGGLNASGYIPASTGERWLILFPDGVFGWHYPEQGFEGFQREAAMQKNPTGWGQYRIDGNRIALHYRTGEVVEGGFDANGTLKIHNVAWLAPWPALDGIRLEGTYARPGSPPVVFDRNGTFTNYGAFTSIIDLDAYGQIVNQEIPQGVGQYRIAQNTLTLAFPTGGVVRMAIFTHQSHTGVAHPDAIMLRGYRYSRAQ